MFMLVVRQPMASSPMSACLSFPETLICDSVQIARAKVLGIEWRELSAVDVVERSLRNVSEAASCRLTNAFVCENVYIATLLYKLISPRI